MFNCNLIYSQLFRKTFKTLKVKICWFPLFIFNLYCGGLFFPLPGKEKPNFVMIVSESHAVSAFGAYKGYLSDVNPTPNLDRISQKSSLFTQAFCTNATSGPSSAVLLTGKHTHLNGFIQNGNKFNTSQDSLPQLLQNSGYQTALFGRWDLGTKPNHFDHWNILVDSTEKYNPEFLTAENQKRIEGHSTDIITDLALDWLYEKKNSKPFFLMIQFNATTSPWMPAIRHLNLFDDKLLPEPENFIDDHAGKASPSRYQSMDINKDLDFSSDLFFQNDRSDENRSAPIESSNSQKNLGVMTPEQESSWMLSWRPKNEAFLREPPSKENASQWKFQRFIKNYLRCVRGIDENIKRIETSLSENNSSDAFFIYTSNHGRLLGEHGWFGSRWIYDESMQVPLIISTNLVIDSANSISSLVQNMDIAQTILDYVGVQGIKDMQGQTMKPLLDNEDSNNTWRNSLYYHYNEFPGNQMVAKHYGIRTSQHKLIHFYQFDEWEFYDLQKDPSESENAYASEAYRPQIEKMKELLLQDRKKYLDQSDISIMPEEWRKIYRGPEARKE